MSAAVHALLDKLPPVPDEVVTQAHVRDTEVPDGQGGAVRIALITLDNGFDHTKPTTIGVAGMRNIARALDDVEARSDIDAVAVTGKPFIFAVGADIRGMAMIRTREQALTTAQAGHALLRRFADIEKPTFAFINGAAMGGGVETALHCDYRTVSEAAVGIGLPEAFLGLVPGWGGAYLTGRLAGIESAITLTIANPLNNNKLLDGRAFAALGFADAVFGGADFLAESLEWAALVVRGSISVERRPLDDAATWATGVAKGRAIAAARQHGANAAPIRTLDLVEASRDADRDAAFAAEDEAIADLVMSNELRASLYAFDLVQRRARKPAGAPDASLARRVTKVGVIGAGLMATQIALLIASRGYVPVVLTDVDQERVDAGLARLRGELDMLVEKGRYTRDRANRVVGLLSGTTDYSDFGDCDLVIEAVFEELEVKRDVFARLEKVVREDALLVTNTSSLSVTAMSEHLEHPERVVGFHFFNPVAVMPLVEVVRTDRTDDATVATVLALGKTLRKSCVIVHDSPAFVVNRLLTRWTDTAIRAIDDGTDPLLVENVFLNMGLPMGPLALMDLVGPPVGLHVAETLHGAFPERFGVSPTLQAIVAGGHRSTLEPSKPGQPPVLRPEVAALMPTEGNTWTADDVRQRTLDALAQEVGLMLRDGVVAGPPEIDLCMVLGAGWPFFNGGITPLLDRTGTSERVIGQRFLPPGIASVPD
jgi:3-hydroxyacyl-CoA dehydrogenase/enoyl-CoA hydratase/carnithine racemase